MDCSAGPRFVIITSRDIERPTFIQLIVMLFVDAEASRSRFLVTAFSDHRRPDDKWVSHVQQDERDSEGAEPPAAPLFTGRYFNVTQNSKIGRGPAGPQQESVSLDAAIAHARELCLRRKDETGSPGLVVAVSVDGELVYSEGVFL